MIVHSDDTKPTVVVIDDDAEPRGGQSFASVAEFLGSARPDLPGCLVLDVRPPGRSCSEFQDDVTKAHVHRPSSS
jgi:FixJ family two-component response regulator